VFADNRYIGKHRLASTKWPCVYNTLLMMIPLPLQSWPGFAMSIVSMKGHTTQCNGLEAFSFITVTGKDYRVFYGA